ncbi:MAG: hypothetical protein KBB10_03535, partial [Clostridia bacterium]|nr:hypothetical protein [Clostridia bacterium]
MKLQGLAVIAIIIILPMTIILSSYSQSQIKTLQLQTQYDSKLQNATYDAIKAFQLNMSNSSTSDLANSKMRDIKASVNTFYNSLASHFNMVGYGKDVLQNYVPAIVYTLYDGYYIYSAYDNTLDADDKFDKNASYKDGENIYGLKPYIYYSCRYKRGNQFDIVITYSLDSYITIQGTIGNEKINKSGYVLSGVEKRDDDIYYKGVKIEEEDMSDSGFQQYVYIPGATATKEGEKDIYINGNKAGAIKKYQCKKINGVKYYIDDENKNKVFTMLNDEQIYQNDISFDNKNTNGKKYYEDAMKFSEWVKSNLGDLSSNDAVDASGNLYNSDNYRDSNPFVAGRKIFSELNNDWRSSSKCIEDTDSEFNAHRIEVIKNSIESNLIVAISNYNKVSSSGVNFQTPKLTDIDWEELTTNVSMITFLQGLNIGGKIYSGYSIVRNDITEDFVSEDSIYICYTNTATYYKVTDTTLTDQNEIDPSSTIGIFNVDFERKTAQVSDKEQEKNIYYYPRSDMASYKSIINSNNNSNSATSIKEYLDKVGQYNSTDFKYRIAQKYYTALGRERYGMYRVTNFLEDVQEDLRKAG